MAPGRKHADHDYIVARQDKYIEAWTSGSPEKVMQFLDKDDFNYSNFASQHEDKPHSVMNDLLKQTFTDHHDLKVKTRSLYGHKRFTAWEWVITCKAAVEPDGNRIRKEEFPPVKVLGCTLMWWNDKDKIVKNHDYMQAREVEGQDE